MEAVEVNGYMIEPGADLRRADLSAVNLAGADLSAVNLEGVDLNGAWLEGTDLPGADLSRANLWGANLEEAVADEGTIWPEGFDPKAAGVIFE